ncbi:MAG: hypothetical protein AAGJ35_00025 [Myxococcota bacterium]
MKLEIMKFETFVSIIVSYGLGILTLFLAYKKKFMDLKKQHAEIKKLEADTSKSGKEAIKIEQEVSASRLSLQEKKFSIRDKLKEECKVYKEYHSLFSTSIDDLSKSISAQEDGSQHRKNAIEFLTEGVFDHFSRYIEKAQIVYSEAEPQVIEVFIESEIFYFLNEVSDFIEIINAENIIEHCSHSKNKVKLSSSSFGTIKICLLTFKDKVSEGFRRRITKRITMLKKEVFYPIED